MSDNKGPIPRPVINENEEDSEDDDTSSTSYGSASTLTTANETSRSNTPTSNRGGRGGGGGGGGKGRSKKSVLYKSKKKYKNMSVPSSTLFKFSSYLKEDHGKSIFGVQFHQKLADNQPLVFATAGPRITIYEACKDGGMEVLLCFVDPDPKEIFYTCAWTDDKEGKPLLAAAGLRGIIRIFSTVTASCVKHFLGHGHSINDLLFHPTDGNLLLSASKDHSLRLWNINTEICVAIFGGVEGHRDEVLSADIDITGTRIVSCGMDHSLKTWNLDKPKIKEAISSSYTYNLKTNRTPFPSVNQNFPDYTTRDVHKNYVDCVKWFGNFILSKSCENKIACWKGGKIFQKWEEITLGTTETSIIHQFDIKECDIWFIRFSMDFWKKMFALGNITGKTYVYDLTAEDPATIKPNILMHPKCTSSIRQTALSRNGDVLICVCDDGTIWRWDLINSKNNKKGSSKEKKEESD